MKSCLMLLQNKFQESPSKVEVLIIRENLMKLFSIIIVKSL